MTLVDPEDKSKWVRKAREGVKCYDKEMVLNGLLKQQLEPDQYLLQRHSMKMKRFVHFILSTRYTLQSVVRRLARSKQCSE